MERGEAGGRGVGDEVRGREMREGSESGRLDGKGSTIERMGLLRYCIAPMERSETLEIEESAGGGRVGERL